MLVYVTRMVYDIILHVVYYRYRTMSITLVKDIKYL